MSRRIPVLCFLIGLVALALSGWRMWARTQEEMLWGFLPLWFYAGLWLCLSAWWLGRRTEASRLRQEVWLLSGLSGLLLGLAWPPLPLVFLLFVGWVPLWEAERRIAAAGISRKGWAVFGASYLAFLLWNALTTYWVTNTAFVAGVFAILVNSLFMALVFTGWHHTRRLLPRLGVAPFIAYWMAFELLHLNWQITWPWLNLGNGFARFPQMVQWYEWTGTFGGTLWVLVANALVWQLWRRRQEGQPFGKWRPLRLALVLVVPLIVSWWRYADFEERGRPVEVVVVQPNFEPHYEKFAVSASAQLQRFLKLSRQGLTDSTAYLVFPETSFGGMDRDRLATDPLIARLRRFIAQWPRLKLVTGIAAYRILPPDAPPTPFTRYTVRRGDTIRWEAYNAAIQLSNETDTIPFYAKSKLVPGAEFLPYKDVLFFLKPIVDALQGSMAGHATQPERSVFVSRDGRVGPVICYESVYGEYYTGYVQQGAEAIFIMTNDGWWDKTAGHRQHLMYASLRAIETRRSIARSANTGISAFIDQHGRIHQPTAYGEEAVIRDTLLLRDDGPTFYV
ncbi:MAG: apolipoprotein N-acyltransferase, partial [Bacteroidetes bacterium]